MSRTNGHCLRGINMSRKQMVRMIGGPHQIAHPLSGQGLLIPKQPLSPAGEDFLDFVGGRKFGTILADPPWQFQNRTGKVAPEHKRLSRYGTMTLDDIRNLP